MSKLHSVATDHYMNTQRILGDHVFSAASVIPAGKAHDLVASRYSHSVALASRFYNLMSVASGNSGMKKFPSMSIAPEHIDNALSKAGPGQLPGAVQALVLSGGRDLITQTSLLDPLAEGWDWITEPGACDYCRSRSGSGSGDFKAHYSCGCIASPRFREG
jgi:hypothetical protein